MSRPAWPPEEPPWRRRTPSLRRSLVIGGSRACLRWDCHRRPAAMRIESAKRAEKDLPTHAEAATQADELGDLLQLVAEAGPWIQRERRDHRVPRGPERAFHFHGLTGDPARAAYHRLVLL